MFEDQDKCKKGDKIYIKRKFFNFMVILRMSARGFQKSFLSDWNVCVCGSRDYISHTLIQPCVVLGRLLSWYQHKRHYNLEHYFTTIEMLDLFLHENMWQLRKLGHKLSHSQWNPLSRSHVYCTANGIQLTGHMLPHSQWNPINRSHVYCTVLWNSINMSHVAKQPIQSTWHVTWYANDIIDAGCYI